AHALAPDRQGPPGLAHRLGEPLPALEPLGHGAAEEVGRHAVVVVPVAGPADPLEHAFLGQRARIGADTCLVEVQSCGELAQAARCGRWTRAGRRVTRIGRRDRSGRATSPIDSHRDTRGTEVRRDNNNWYACSVLVLLCPLCPLCLYGESTARPMPDARINYR